MSCDLPKGLVLVDAGMVEHVGRRMREEHRREISILLGGFADPLEMLVRACRMSYPCLAGVRDGEMLFICGVSGIEILSETGIGWLMGTPAMDRHGVWIADLSRRALPLLHRMSGARRIMNSVPANYAPALKWLRWLGFVVAEETHMINGVPHRRVWHDAEVTHEP